MTMNRLTSWICLGALGLCACAKQDPPRSVQEQTAWAPAASPASDDPSSSPSPSPAAEPAAQSASPTAAPQNALGIPDAPPAASQGPEAGEASDSPPTRTPDVVYVPTPQPVVDRMLQMAQVKKGDVVYDLGCGDGRIVVTAAKRYGVRAIGFDIDPDRVDEARANVRAAKLEHLVTIEHKDIFTLDLSPASVVTLYLLPKLNVRLIPQLEKLKPGSRIVSHDFDMEGVEPVQHVTLRPTPDSEQHSIFLWRTPLVRR